MIAHTLPEPWYDIGSQLLDFFYYPGVALILIIGLTTLYKLALHTSLPWHRLLGGSLVAGVFFIAASAVLRLYLRWVAETGASYGALAGTIAFLLFTFFLGFAVVLDRQASTPLFRSSGRHAPPGSSRCGNRSPPRPPTARPSSSRPVRSGSPPTVRDLERGDSREERHADDRAAAPGSGTAARPDPGQARLTETARRAGER